MTNKIAVFRRARFNAAHRLYCKDWSFEKNDEVFGKCNNPSFHGHNYSLEVKLIGNVDPETGFLINLNELKDILKEEVEDRFDHKNLNLDCEEFAQLNPTVENITIVIYNLLRKRLDENKYEIVVRLYETENNYAEYPIL
ncbi:MAG: 6-carboxytetrahydropterin synthase [Chitinophagales bacterium]|nr:6-carboxytetrahydropterin synthase [Chitinophagales bacterium]